MMIKIGTCNMDEDGKFKYGTFCGTC